MLQFALRAAMLASACLLAGCSLLRFPGAAAGAPVAIGLDQSGAPAPSPDGKKLMWQVVAGGGVSTLVRDAESGETSVFRLGRAFPYWAYDSRHLIVEQDRDASDTHILLVDTARPNARPLDLTPWQGRKSFVIHTGDAGSGKLTFISNRRDADTFDVYTAGIVCGCVELMLKNSGDVVQWVMDEDGTVGARVRRQDEHMILQVRNKATQSWKSVYKWRHADVVLPVRIERDAGRALLVSNVGREKAELMELRVTGLGK